MWIKKEEGGKEPKVGQSILMWWDSTAWDKKEQPHPQICCFIYKGKYLDGDWRCDFLWGSGRFGSLPPSSFFIHIKSTSLC